MDALGVLRSTVVPVLPFPSFIVGGAVRDALLEAESKDIDIAVEAPSFEAMLDALCGAGAQVFLESPEFGTVRAKSVLKGAPALDFVLCRKDGPSSDGRRPDFVEVGSIVDDLSRRDFTVNALALDLRSGRLIDPFGGREDLEAGVLRFVGDPFDRIREDGLRVLRGFRFMVTKGFKPARLTADALFSPTATRMLECVSVERIREELVRMFQADTLQSLQILSQMTPAMRAAIFRDGLRLDATLKA